MTSSGSPANTVGAGVAGREDHCDRLGQRRRATNASVCTDTWSSHCASSTTQSKGWSFGGRSHQAEHRQPDQETIRRRPDSAAESDVQRLALRFRQLVEVVQQRRTQLLQPGEREFHVGLYAGHLDDAESRRQL